MCVGGGTLPDFLFFLLSLFSRPRAVTVKSSVSGSATGTLNVRNNNIISFSMLFVVVIVYVILTNPLRIQPWSQDRRNQTNHLWAK